MYKIYLDGKLFCSPVSEELAISNPVVTLERNKAGTFKFTVAPVHPRYNDITERCSVFEVYRDDETEPLFAGPCMKVKKDFYNQKTIECEGELTYFNDSIQRPKKYQGVSVRQLLESYVASHNAQVDEWKRFTVGNVTVHDANDYIYCYTNNNSTMTELKEDLIDDLGGYFSIRHENGVRYLDYLAEPIGRCTQAVRLGENLLDYSDNIDMTQIATVVIPLGEKLEQSEVEGLDTRLTIESVNAGKDYLVSEAADTYGKISTTVIFDNVTKAANLLSKGKKYLSDTQFANLVISLKAFDLSWVSEQERFKLNYDVQVISKPHGLNRWMPIAKQTFYLWNPENDTLELGISQKKTLSARTATTYKEVMAAIESITPASSILESAKKNATALITSAMGGYVYKTSSELYIMDASDPAKAKKVWRWNINGLGYSSNGVNGPYGLAMTMDGSIVADFITAGSMSCNRLRGGTIALGGTAGGVGGNGKVEVYNASGQKIVVLDVNGLDVTTGAIKGSSINTANDNFYVTKAGYMHASDGDIGGLKINSNSLSGGGYYDTTISSSGIYSDTLKGYSDVSGGGSLLSSGYVYGGESTMRLVSSEGHGLQVSSSDIIPVGYPTLGSSSGGWSQVYADYIWAGFKGLQVGAGGNAVIEGSLTVEGDKNRVVATEDYGRRLLYAYETATPMFADIGEGVIDENGECVVYIDDVFLQTINSDIRYQVFIQVYGSGSCRVEEREGSYFKVSGTPGLCFAWEIKGVQKDGNLKRLEIHETDSVEPDDMTIIKAYADDIAGIDVQNGDDLLKNLLIVSEQEEVIRSMFEELEEDV